MDQKIRKLMSMHKVLHLRAETDSICQEKKEEDSIKDSMDVPIRGHDDYAKKNKD